MNLFMKAKKFLWDEDYEEAFRQLKVTLATLFVLSKPDTSKKLIVYLLVLIEVISAVLVQEEGSELRSVYFVSRVLQDPETRYQVMEKVALAHVNVVHHLLQYF